MPITITTRVENQVAKEIDRIAKAESTDRSTVIRKFLEKETKEWEIQKALEDYEAGKISLRRAAARCNLSLWEMIGEIKKHGTHLPYSVEDLKEDLENL